MNTLTRVRAVAATLGPLTRTTIHGVTDVTATLSPYLVSVAVALAGVARHGACTVTGALTEAWTTGKVPATLTRGDR